jgi:hypothetical protein
LRHLRAQSKRAEFRPFSRLIPGGKLVAVTNDKRFVEKVQDIVGLCLNPPDKALVLSVDEKNQIQALVAGRR